MFNQMALIAFYTILRKEIYRILVIWPQTLLPSAVTMCLYFVIFGNLIGERIGDMGGYPYITYILPGLVMMAVITNAYGNVVSSFSVPSFSIILKKCSLLLCLIMSFY